MNILIIFVLLTGVLLLILGLQYLQERRYYRERILRIHHEDKSTQPTFAALMNHLIQKLISMLGTWSLFKPLLTAEFRKKIVLAGWLSKKAPEVFIGSVVLIDALLLSILVLIMAHWQAAFSFFAGSMLRLLISGLALTYCFTALPRLVLARIQKEYVKTIVRELADFFELYIINISAGKSNIVALQNTLSIIQDIYPRVGAQINFLIGELQTLPNHELAWKNFSDRIDNPEIKDAIKIIRHCDALGLPVEQDLHQQINHMRQTYLTKIEEKIMRLSTTLLLPMFLFIFPSLFIITLTPALIKILAMLK